MLIVVLGVLGEHGMGGESPPPPRKRPSIPCRAALDAGADPVPAAGWINRTGSA
ncbi:hypothetical protein [Actinacidiphila oryziradicis]|uniref:hypothetical protein n=1 Tax=Actinacidiphila oryziradicis TaxID=2571141 RepID=UPI00145C5FFA|nr:hypothetical protein [Actinacidiphila oryziradicis]